MKNTLALVLMVFGLVGCATNYGLPQDTSETTMERARYCQVSNINKYWGDCWIQRSKQEVAFFEWIDVLEMEQESLKLVMENQIRLMFHQVEILLRSVGLVLRVNQRLALLQKLEKNILLLLLPEAVTFGQG